ncbi:MAG: DnaJ domain-containing protein [Thermoplasmata archaeon]
MRDYYKILGVKENATLTEIKKAYKNLIARLEPKSDKDKNSKQLQEAIFLVKEAFSVLSDKKKRAQYDRMRNASKVCIPQVVANYYYTDKYYRKGGAGSVKFDMRMITKHIIREAQKGMIRANEKEKAKEEVKKKENEVKEDSMYV